MDTATAAGALLLALPILFNATFAALGRSFDYPDVLRRPPGEVLAAFDAGGARLRLTWWLFGLAALLFVPASVLLAEALDGASPAVRTLSVALGAVAGAVQAVGLARWPFAVPALARAHVDPASTTARREAVEVVFDALNRSLGVGIGEHLGYLLTGAWSAVTGVAIIQSDVAGAWLGWAGVALAPAFVLGSLEFVGSAEPRGLRAAAAAVPVAYVVWSLWLLTIGVVLLT